MSSESSAVLSPLTKIRFQCSVHQSCVARSSYVTINALAALSPDVHASSSADELPFSSTGRIISNNATVGEREDKVDRVVRQIESGPTLKHAVRWYRYSRKENTIEQPENILRHFIARFQRHIQFKGGGKSRKRHSRQNDQH